MRRRVVGGGGGDHGGPDPTAPGIDDGRRLLLLGLAEGSEATAALASAVLGGIAVGTCSTLLFVPFLYAVLRRGEVRPLEDYV